MAVGGFSAGLDQAQPLAEEWDGSAMAKLRLRFSQTPDCIRRFASVRSG